MMQLGGFHGRFLEPLMTVGLPLLKNVIKPSAKSVLITLGLAAAESTPYTEFHELILGWGTTALIF